MNSKFLNLEIHLHYSLLTRIINKTNIKKINILLKAAHLSSQPLCRQSRISRFHAKQDYELSSVFDSTPWDEGGRNWGKTSPPKCNRNSLRLQHVGGDSHKTKISRQTSGYLLGRRVCCITVLRWLLVQQAVIYIIKLKSNNETETNPLDIRHRSTYKFPVRSPDVSANSETTSPTSLRSSWNGSVKSSDPKSLWVPLPGSGVSVQGIQPDTQPET